MGADYTGLATRDIRANPLRQLRVRDFVGCQRENGRDGIELAHAQLPAIDCQEQSEAEKCRALVTVQERMVLGPPEAIRGRELRMVDICAVVKAIAGAPER